MRMNEAAIKASRAKRAIDAYEKTGYFCEDLQTTAQDLITDLYHYINIMCGDDAVSYVRRVAFDNYEAEILEVNNK